MLYSPNSPTNIIYYSFGIRSSREGLECFFNFIFIHNETPFVYLLLHHLTVTYNISALFMQPNRNTSSKAEP